MNIFGLVIQFHSPYQLVAVIHHFIVCQPLKISNRTRRREE